VKDGEYSEVGANPSCPNCARLNARVAELEAVVAVIPALRALLEQAQKKIRNLEERLGQDSTNSHKPPSQDPPGARERPEKKPSVRKPGGQLGHQGKNRDLLPPEDVDQFVVYTPPACDHCHHDFPAIVPLGLPVLRHQVVDLPEKAYTVIEHRVYAMACDDCGHVSHGELPEEVACSSFGPKLTALASFLTGACQTSRRLVEEIIEDVLGIPIALGTITNMEAEVTQALEAPYQEAAGAAREAAAKNLDETSWKDQNKNVWLWTLATASVAFFVIHRNRGIRGLKALVGGVLRGVFTSDRWGAYRIRALGWRQICWAHLVRDFQKLIDRGRAAAGIGQRAKELAGELFMVWRDFKEGGIDRATLRVTLAPVRMELRALLEEGASTLCALDEKAATFCQNLLDLEPALWAFLRYEGVEPTNNHAERVLRRGVLWRKRSFGSRSERGLRFAERILTVVQTRRLQRQRVFPFLVQAVTARRAGKPAPSLLPA
jgi:transposase